MIKLKEKVSEATEDDKRSKFENEPLIRQLILGLNGT